MLSMAKDCEVEVSSEDEGFKGAWYRAILQENPTKSGRKKLQICYMTLVDEDGSSLLTELVEQRLIRPVPPEDPNPNNGVDFEEGSVVDADLKDGWWTGVVVKKMADDDKFLVYFDHPPDLMQFQRKQLRTHLDLIGSEWVRPENKELSKSLSRSGTMVEVSCKIDKLEDVWVPALIVKEDNDDDEQKRFIVKCCDDKSFTFDGDDDAKPNILAVDLCNVRPKPPPCFVEKYDLLDRVDAFRGGLGWRQGLVRRILSEERYIVSFVATKEESVFKHSNLRLSQDWEDGVWLQQPKSLTKPGNKTPSQGKRKMSMETTLTCRPKMYSTAAKPITYKRTRKRSKTSSENVETIGNERESVAAIELSLARVSLNQKADDARNGDDTPVIMIPTAKESAPPASAVIFATTVKETELETQGETSPLRNQNVLGVDSNGEKNSEEHYSNDNTHRLIETGGEACNGSKALITDYICDDDDNDDQPLSSWILGEKSSTSCHKSKLSHDTATVLPFVKHSPVWQVFESMEVFRSVKQRPHFSPLLESREEFREGLAAGEMVKYFGLLERVENLQLHTPKSTLERLRECFFELDKYGFDVVTPISRIEMLLSLKDTQVKRLDELNDKEKKVAEEVVKKEKVEEDLREVERKILELRSQETELKDKKVALEKEIGEMQLFASTLDKKIQDVEVEFQMIVSSPW